MIGTQTITAEKLDKVGDREDFKVRVVGPDPSTDFTVPLKITGTALAIWGTADPQGTAVELANTIFDVKGTATLPPKEGFLFDSYNSGGTVRETLNKIRNEGVQPFLKDVSEEGLFYIHPLGAAANKKIKEADKFFLEKFNRVFFRSLEDMAEESQLAGDISTAAKDYPSYIYGVCILGGIIDHIDVRLDNDEKHICNICDETCRVQEGSLQSFKRWLSDKLGKQKSNELTQTFQMIRHLRNQYPVHNSYDLKTDGKQIRSQITIANNYFGITSTPTDYAHNSQMILHKFTEALDNLIKSLSSN